MRVKCMNICENLRIKTFDGEKRITDLVLLCHQFLVVNAHTHKIENELNLDFHCRCEWCRYATYTFLSVPFFSLLSLLIVYLILHSICATYAFIRNQTRIQISSGEKNQINHTHKNSNNMNKLLEMLPQKCWKTQQQKIISIWMCVWLTGWMAAFSLPFFSHQKIDILLIFSQEFDFRSMFFSSPI